MSADNQSSIDAILTEVMEDDHDPEKLRKLWLLIKESVDKVPEAAKWARKAAERIKDTDGQDARIELECWVQQGDPNAQYQMGLTYRHGICVERDLYRAFQLFLKSAQQGHPGAQFDLGRCYDNGYGIDQDSKEAVHWYGASAHNGNVAGMCAYGICLRDGKGVHRNEQVGWEWINKAAEHGDSYAMREMASASISLERDWIETAKKELHKKPLVVVDLLVETFSKPSYKPIAEDLELLTTAIFVASASGWKHTDTKKSSLFDKAASAPTQDLAASSLLRLLTYGTSLFDNFRVNAFQLFDRVFPGTLYKYLSLEKGYQTYEKESKLTGIVPQIESELDQIIASLSSLDLLSKFQEAFMRKLKSIPCKSIVEPFLPKGLLDLRLTDVFSVVREYLEENSLGTISFEHAIEVLSKYTNDAERHGTRYSRDYLMSISTKLTELLREHFDNSPFSKPAEMTVEKIEKKYPLSSAENAFQLGFVVTNHGPGQAFEVSLKVNEVDTGVGSSWQGQSDVYLGQLKPASVILKTPVQAAGPASSVTASLQLTWTNFDRTRKEKEFIEEFEAQRSDIDWDSLTTKEPYSLEPVETESELIGRQDVLRQLIAQAQAKSMGSSYVFGQKRVGKTSVAKTLRTTLIEANTRANYLDFLVLYIQRGDYAHRDPIITLENLGAWLCKKVRRSDKRLLALDIPTFSGSLSPLAEFLESVLDVVPEYRILFILDEFDELPLVLYKRGPDGDAFFGTLRSISDRAPFGFVLVGSENMKYIISIQGYALNKFQKIPLDYFDKEHHWSDFQDLIRRPVEKWLEIADDALVALYQKTAGNPFFTKLICSRLARICIEQRDCHVTKTEVEHAAKIALSQDMGTEKVQHFWTDGIWEAGVRHEEISLCRRKVLLALAEVIRVSHSTKKADIIKVGQDEYGLDESLVERDLRDFQQRQVLVEQSNEYDFKVPFFKEWLVDYGVNDIITCSLDQDALLERKKREEESRVRPEEITKLVGRWGVYQGLGIGEDKVRAWLNQFGDNSNQRLMFKILEGLTFYTQANIRQKMREGQGIVMRSLAHKNLVHKIEKKKRSDILVSYLDKLAKSGAHYAKLYADENKIYVGNVIEKAKLGDAITKAVDINALAFIDDFIGTGDSACKYFRELEEMYGDLLQKQDLFLLFISGFVSAKTRVEDCLSELGLQVQIHICDPLDDSARIFGELSTTFSNPAERNRAREICYEYGARLVKSYPLGYGDCQAAIVFEDTCPNNTLPILWSEKDWVPLFPRL